MSRRARTSVFALLAYAALSFLYFGLRVLPHPGRELVGFGRDPQIFVWAIGWWPHAIAHGENPFVTHALFAPDGVNLAWTTSIPGVSLPLAPVTALFGPVVAYDVAAVLLPALAAWTAFLLCRHLTARTWPSLVGGYLFGFSAYMFGQELGHVHMTSVFLVPAVALVILRFVEGGLGPRGLVIRLGLLLALQVYLSTEVFFTVSVALAAALGLAAWLVHDVRPRLRALRAPLAGAYALALVLAAPLLAFAATGFERRSINLPEDFSADLLNVVVPTRLVAAGAVWAPGIAARFPGNDAERGAYLGLPLLAIVVLFAVRSRRRPGVRFLLASLGLAWFGSLGTALWVAGHRVVPLPWDALAWLPGFDNVLPSRLAMFASLAAAVAVALWAAEAHPRLAVALPALAVLALVPRLDIPVWSTAPARPAFFAQDEYRLCLWPSDNVLVVPFGAAGDSMLWQAESGYAFRLAGGYVRPTPPPSYLRYSAIANLHFGGQVPPPHDLETFMRDKRVTKVVVADADAAAWAPSLTWLGRPTEVGGMAVYPGCGA
ncbi:MAG: hypothetical protein ACXVZL_12305 [Gaiellaceae bacterium]